MTMLPEAAAAIAIADKHLSWASIEARKALALDIQAAIIQCAGIIATEAIQRAMRKIDGPGERPRETKR